MLIQLTTLGKNLDKSLVSYLNYYAVFFEEAIAANT